MKKRLLLLVFIVFKAASISWEQNSCDAKNIFAQTTLNCSLPNEDMLCVTLDISESIDKKGISATYDWDFGDGQLGKGITPQHCYSVGGTYQAILTVKSELFGAVLEDSYTTLVSIPSILRISYTQPKPKSRGFSYYFNAYDSYIERGIIIDNYYWDFGDGTFQCGGVVFHRYQEQGAYQIRLIAKGKDSKGDEIVFCVSHQLAIQ